ncbi:MAG: RNA polymerase sigma factor [Hyphomicrobiales bacterium]|nr:RNA polymerase sigma factor [Hyphomicrobiales bacterium]
MTSDIREEIVAFLPRLRRFAYALTGNLADGDDLVQDACLRALDRAHQWQPGTRLDSWMYRIAQNLWIDKVRAAKVRSDAKRTMLLQPDETRTAQNPAEDRLALQAVSAGIAELPAEQQMVVSLVCIDGMSYREAAEVTGVPIGTVMSRLSRARRALHGKLHGETDE